MTDLALLPLTEFELKPRGGTMRSHRFGAPWQIKAGKEASFRRQSQITLELNPPLQLHQLCLRRFPFHHNPVGLLNMMLRISQALDQRTVVGEKQQAFTVAIQTTRRIDAWHINILLQRGMTCAFIREL